MKHETGWVIAGLLAAAGTVPGQERDLSPLGLAKWVLEETRPLAFPRGGRLPFIVWGLRGLPAEPEAELESLLRGLDERGIATVTPWGGGDRQASLDYAARVAGIQKKLGLEVVVDTTGVMGSFFNGDERTAHVRDNGEPFFDLSFSPGVKIGCPFTVHFRYEAIREQVEFFVRAYRERDLPLDVLIADWEVDGPIEWNEAWAHSRQCRRCREHIANIGNFHEFQAALRVVRCEMQREAYASVVKRYYPRALVGNYAVCPHGGWRHWYDYFEADASDDMPFLADQGARYRPWFHEFSLTGFTFAMPVVYTWYRTFGWYDFAEPDYRWFYNLLLVASDAGRHTAANIPIISFVHWHTTAPPDNADPAVRQLSEARYRELLWHMLLRGHDGLAMWCMGPETGVETRLVQEVYAASLEFRDFLDRGEPAAFDVPPQPGPVVSGLKLGDRVLVRRTDFDARQDPAPLRVGETTLQVPRLDGKCQVLEVKRE
jgi:hypothetical protein